MSSDIDFTPFCGNRYCFSLIKAKNGLVLSCGCFLCHKCSLDLTDQCPVCDSRGVRAVSLKEPPLEVGSVTCDTAQDFEKIFTALKFQIKHYKSSLNCMKRVINLQTIEIENMHRFSKHYL